MDTLISAVETQKNVPDAPLYRCSLGKHYIKLNSSESPNYHFESDVTKFQRGDVDDLSHLELAACAQLKLKFLCDDLSIRSFDDERTMSMAELLRSKKDQKTEISNECINLDFIIGSTASIERLFSFAGDILCNNRRRITPQLFEALLLLKVNRMYWNLETVRAAIAAARSNRTERLIAEDEEHDLQEEL